MKKVIQRQSRYSHTLQMITAAIFLLAGGMFAGLPTTTAATSYAGGDGASGSPYQISDLAELRRLSETSADWTGTYFVLTADIDAAETSLWNSGDHDGDGGTPNEAMGFSPIGNGTTPFSGSLDAQGYQILNLTINRPATQYVGFFGYLGSGAVVSGLGIQECSVSGGDNTGALAGYVSGATVSACGVINGTVAGGTNVGGLAGCNTGTSVIGNCFAALDVSGTDMVGGIVGVNTGEQAMLSNSFSQATAASGNVAGAIVAQNSSATVSGCVYDETIADGTAGIGMDDSSEVTYNLVRSLFSVKDFATEYSWSFGTSSPAPWTDGSDDLRPYFYNQPVVTSMLSEKYTTETATLFGGIPSGSGRSVALYGIEWSANADFSSSTSTDADNLDGENFSVTVSWLSVNSTYYYKAYVVDTNGNKLYGAKESFSKSFYSGGSGTESEPFLISDVSDLKYLSEHGNDGDVDHWNRVLYFSQTADINMADTVNWNVGDHDNSGGTPDEAMGFSPIGSSSAKFKGKYYGNGYDIANLTVNRPERSYVGLFGRSYEATFEGIELVDCTVFGNRYTGTLCGYADRTTMELCSASGTVSTSGSIYNVGGLAGIFYYGSYAYNCSSSVDVTNTDGTYTGGLFGENRGYLYDCYSSGTVIGGNSTGGLVGHNYYYTLERCYFSGYVSGGQYTGGLLGKVYSSSTVRDCYVSGYLSGGADSGVLIGYSFATFSDTYWDRNTSTTGVSLGIDFKSQTVSPKTTAEAIVQANNTGFAFNSNAWQIQDGFTRPYLSQQRIAVMNRNPSVYMEAGKWVILEPGYVYHAGDGDSETAKTVVDYGFLYKQDGVPTITDGTKVGGNQSASLAEESGAEIASVTLSDGDGLVAESDYFARAYAVDSDGTVCYGDTVFFRTEILPPTVITEGVADTSVTDETTGSVQLAGFLDLPGNLYGESVTEYGVIYSESTFDPTAQDFDPSAVGFTTISSSDALSDEQFILTVSGLTRYQKYFYSAYAVNTSGLTDYGSVVDFAIYYSGGNGSQSKPFVLKTAAGLRYLSEHGNDSGVNHWEGGFYFDQQVDIDMSDSVNWNVGDHDNDVGTPDEAMGFIPIGNSSERFKGEYEGNGFKISGLFINRPVTDYVGLFGDLYITDNIRKEVRNVILKNCNITGKGHVGALAGRTYYYELKNCFVSGEVHGNGANVGGLVGYNYYQSNIRNCGSSADVTNTATGTGGLVGYNYYYIYDSYATGSVNSSGTQTGGLVGYLTNYRIYESYASGAVIGTTYVGGLVGYANSGYVYDSFASGYISGSDKVGGLFGYCNATVYDSSYWDKNVSGYANDIGENISGAEGVGLTTAEMLLQSSYADFPFNSSAWSIQDALTRPYPSQRQVVLMNRRAKVYLQNDRWVVFDPGYIYHAGDADSSTNNTVVDYGFIYKKDSVPTVVDGTKVGGNQSASLAEEQGAEIATVTLVEADGLVRDAIYFMRAYAVDSNGNAWYGDTVLFNTEAKPPALTTQDPSERVVAGATGDGKFNAVVNSIGTLEEETITEYGFIYSESTFDPTAQDFDPSANGLVSVSSTDEVSGASFSLPFADLTVQQLYYCSAYAVNSSGMTGYGNVLTFRIYYSGGDGSTDIPFKISSSADLRYLSEHGNDGDVKHWDTGKFFELTADIDMADSANWNVGNHDNNGDTPDDAMGFIPIGDNSTNFRGTFDGKAFAVSNLFINRPLADYIGLFGHLYKFSDSARILKDIRLVNCNITGRQYVGALAGRIYDVDVHRCSSSGTVNGNGNYSGGLIGYNYYYANIYDSRSSVDVTNTGNETGGLIGHVNWYVYDSHASGNVTSTGESTGGFAGLHSSYTVERCSASGAVFGADKSGGFIGEGFSGSRQYDCYSTGYVSGGNYTGGFMGYCDSSSIQTCYWDTETSKQSTGIAWSSASQSASPLKTAEALSKSNYTGFSFSSTHWNIFDTLSRPYTEYHRAAVMNGSVITYSEGTVYMNKATVAVPDDGNEITSHTVVEYGVMYKQDDIPVEGGSGVVKAEQVNSTLNEGEFAEISGREMTGLTENATYYARSYAIAGSGDVYYGDTVQFIPQAVAPLVETMEPLILTPDYVKVPSKILSKGTEDSGVSITQYGFVYSQTAFTDPTALVNPSTNAVSGDKSGVYYIDFNDVTEDATYYYAAFAKNSSGATGYGEVKQFVPRFYSGGEGTEVDPFLMGTYKDLTYLSRYASTYSPTHWQSGVFFRQIADIDASSTALEKDSESDPSPSGFLPIGPDSNTPFGAAYNGNGYKIQGLTISRSTATTPVGFFGYASGAVIQNMTFMDTLISGNTDVGVVSGYVSASSQVFNCSVSGNVSGVERVGGIAGSNNSSTVFNSYSCAIVESDNEAGGIVGVNDGGEVSDCYTTGYVSSDTAGGLVGSSLNGSTVATSYTSGISVGTTYAGTLIGSNSANSTVTNSYWDSDSSGSDIPFGTDLNAQSATARISSEMKNSSYFSGFSFSSSDSSPWQISNGTSKPYLYWQDVVVTAGPPLLVDYNKAESAVWFYNLNKATNISVNEYGYIIRKDAPPSISTVVPTVTSDGTVSMSVPDQTISENNYSTFTGASQAVDVSSKYYARAYVVGSDGMVYYGDLSYFRTEPEEKVTLAASSSAMSEYNGEITLTATLTGTLNYDVTVALDYTGTAVRNTDFSAPTTITVSAGETTGTATITSIDNRIDAADKTIVVDVSNVVFAIEDATQQVSLTVADDDVTPTLSVTNLSKVYNGSSQTPTAVTDPDGINVVFTYDSSSTAPTDAGSYVLVATVDQVGYVSVSVTDTFTISPATLSVTADAKTQQYGDPQVALTYTTSPDGVTVTGSLSKAAGIAIGTYPISAGTISAGSNYTIDFTGADYVITKKELGIIGLTAADKVYDGTSSATISGTAALSGVVSGDLVSVIGTASGTYADENVGNGINVALFGLTLSGTDKDNYSLNSPSLTAAITKKSVTATVNIADKVYDGTTTASLANTDSVLNGLISGDTVSLDLSGAIASFNTASVGTEKSVTVGSAVLTGADAANYSLGQVTGQAGISKRLLTATADNKSRHFTQADPVFTCSYEGFVDGDSAAVLTTEPVLSTSATSGSTPGQYVIEFSTNAQADNYAVTQVDGVLTVTNVSPSIATSSWQGTVREDASVNTTVGAAHSAADTDLAISGASEALTFSLTDATGTFGIDSTSGQIRVISTSNLNFEQISSIDISVKAADVYGAIGTKSFTVSVSDVNEAPVLSANSPTLTTLNCEETVWPSYTVEELLGEQVSDVDSGAVEGIAVFAADLSKGYWEYKLKTTSGQWTAFPSVSGTSALLLGFEDSVRFVPAAIDFYDASFSFRAWDQAQGTAGGTADVSSTGGWTAFSDVSDLCEVSVSPKTYSVSFEAGTGGNISGEISQQIIFSTSGTSVTAVSAEGYSFDYWYVTSGQIQIADASKASTTVKPYSDGVVKAVFTELPPQEYELTMVAETGGTVSPSGVKQVVHNEPISVSATAADGWQFAFWKLDGYAEVKDPFLPNTTLYVTGVATVRAVFKETPVEYSNLTVLAASGGTSVPAPGVYEKAAGSSFSIAATPAQGMMFDYWLISGSAKVTDPNSASTGLTIDDDASLKPIFRTVPVETYTLTIHAPVEGTGAVNPSAGNYSARKGERLQLAAVAEDGYYFKHWSVDGPAELADPKNPNTSVVLQGNATVAAVFEQRVETVELKVSSDPEDGGTTNPGAVVYTLDKGSSMAFKAIPAAGMQFVEWIVEGPTKLTSNELAETRITVDGNSKLRAVFTETVKTVTMTLEAAVLDTDNTVYTGDNSCSITPGPGQHSVNAGESQQLKAIPDEGFEFVHWVITGEGKIANPGSPQTSVTLLENAKVTCRFRKTQETVSLTLGVTPANSGSLNPGAAVYTPVKGGVMEVSAVAESGWHFKNWKSTGNVVISDPFKVSVSMSAYEDATIQAVFEEDVKQVELTLAQAEGGFTNPGAGVFTVNAEELFTLEARSTEGYTFTRWRVDGDAEVENAIKPSTSVKLKGDATVKPIFTKVEKENHLALVVQKRQEAGMMMVSDSAPPEETNAGGYTNPGDGLYSVGVGVRTDISATPDPGWHFVNWSIVQGHVEIEDVYADETTAVVLDDSVEAIIQAVFEEDAQQTPVTVSVQGDGTTSSGVGVRTYTVGEPVKLIAVPGDGSLFDKWTIVSGNASLTSTSSKETYLTTADADPVELRAEFVAVAEDEYQLTLTASPEDGGAVTPGFGTRTLNDGAWLEVEAVAESGYSFQYWQASGAAEVENSVQASSRVRLNGANGTLTATFQASDPLDRLNDAIVDGDITTLEEPEVLTDLETLAGDLWVPGNADEYISDLEKAATLDSIGVFEVIVEAVNADLKTSVVRCYNGWNLLGSPYSGCIPEVIFGSSVSGNIFTYKSGSYTVLEDGSPLVTGYGYWMYMSGLPAAGQQFVMIGEAVEEDAKNLPIEEGWNLLSMYDVPGSQRKPADTEGRFAEVWKYVTGHPFAWDAENQKYISETDTLELGLGYWGYLVNFDAYAEAAFTSAPFALNWDSGALSVRLSGSFDNVRLGLWDNTNGEIVQTEATLSPAADGSNYAVTFIPEQALVASHSYFVQVTPVRPGIRGNVLSARFQLPAQGTGTVEIPRYLEDALTTASVSWNGSECTVVMDDAPSRNFVEYTIMKQVAGESVYTLVENKLTMIDSQNRLIVDVQTASIGDKISLSYRLTADDGTPVSSWKTMTKVFE